MHVAREGRRQVLACCLKSGPAGPDGGRRVCVRPLPRAWQRHGSEVLCGRLRVSRAMGWWRTVVGTFFVHIGVDSIAPTCMSIGPCRIKLSSPKRSERWFLQCLGYRPLMGAARREGCRRRFSISLFGNCDYAKKSADTAALDRLASLREAWLSVPDTKRATTGPESITSGFAQVPRHLILDRVRLIEL